MTALALVYPIQNLITAIGVGIGIGINAGIAYYLGAKKQTTANQIATQGIALSVLHGILLTVLCGNHIRKSCAALLRCDHTGDNL